MKRPIPLLDFRTAFFVLAGVLIILAGCTLSAGSAPVIAPAIATVQPPIESGDGGAEPKSTSHDQGGPTPTNLPPSEQESVTLSDPSLERRVVALPLAAPLDDRDQEFSALAWHGDRLVLVPQFPERYNNRLFAIERADILAHIRGESDGPLPFTEIALNDRGFSQTITGFDGYEAIAFDGDQVYMTVETRPGTWMLGYLIGGRIDAGSGEITFDFNQRTPIPTQAALQNMTDETIVVDGERIITLFEANGVNVNAEPVANVFSRSGEKLAPIPFPNLEYRITDATEIDEDRRFWAINYFWPGDEKLKPGDDLLAAKYGKGLSHAGANGVERLVEFQVTDEGITLTDAPPLQLQLLPAGIVRNWEGVARLQDGDVDGFLLVTDKFPFTELGFVER